MSLSTKLPLELMQDRWASELNPLLANPLSNVSILSNIRLSTGVNVINHLLGRMQQGWYIVDKNGIADIFRSAPFNKLTLTLTSSATVTVSIGVF